MICTTSLPLHPHHNNSTHTHTHRVALAVDHCAVQALEQEHDEDEGPQDIERDVQALVEPARDRVVEQEKVVVSV